MADVTDEDAGLTADEVRALRSNLPPVQSNTWAPGQLPILAFEKDIGRLLNIHRSLLVLGETGCGKSTQLPQILVRLGWTGNGFRIAVIQPSRLVASRLADRLCAEAGDYHFAELRVDAGKPVAACPVVVFDQTTFLKRAFRSDPSMSEFSCIFLDEVHERTVEMDLICGLLKRVMEYRDDIRLCLASASMDTKSIARYFGNCALLVCEGRTFPINVAYLKAPTWDFLDRCFNVVIDIHSKEPIDVGDILVFVPRREDCDELLKRLVEYASPSILCAPLHDAMSLREQQVALTVQQHGKRKVLVSTDIAETSLTIPNIGFVVDSLFTSNNVYDPKSGLISLVTRGISRARADQRAGRAGRIAPGGKCYRLSTEADFRRLLPRHDEANILRSDLVDAVLFLKSLGVSDVCDFPYISMPSSGQFIRAFDVLYSLGALDEEAEITEDGRFMSRLPLSISLAKMIVKAFEFPGLETRVVDLVSSIACGIAAQVLASCTMSTLATFAAREGDHLTLCNLVQGGLEGNRYWKAMSHERLETFKSFRSMLRREITRLKGNVEWRSNRVKQETNGNQIMNCVIAGLFPNVARLQANGRYKTAREGIPIKVHSSSVLVRLGKPPEWIIFQESILVRSNYLSLFPDDDQSDGSVTVRIVSALDPRLLVDIAPHFWQRVSREV